MFNSKPAHQAVQCKVSCSPHPWVEQPEDEGAQEAEAGEEKIDRKVNRWRWLREILKEDQHVAHTYLLHGDRRDHLEDGPWGDYDDECQGDG